MKRLKWASDFLNDASVVVHSPIDYQGRWNDLLKRSIIHIEIGSGKGDYWIGMSQQYSDIGWIGIEKNESAAALAVRKSGELQEHRRFIHGDASQIETWFKKGEVQVIHLNFSDPWPKKRTSKRRLSHTQFLSKYAKILSDDGEIQMKTDNVQLFEYSILTVQENGFKLVDFSVDYRRESHPEDVVSEYENKFMEQGKPIYRAVWKKIRVMEEANENDDERIK